MMALHRWRLFARSDNLEAARRMSEITSGTEDEPIDQWFDGETAVFCGRGDPPEDPHIEERECTLCDGVAIDCWWCCETGKVLTWIDIPQHMIDEAIAGLREMVQYYEMKDAA